MYQLEILNSDLKDQVFSIETNLSIGRKDRDILLTDESISSHHADIKVLKNNRVILIDNNSKNGIKLNLNGERKSEIILEDGLEFFIGRVHCKVNLISKNSDGEFHEFIKKHLDKFPNKNINLSPFPDHIYLHFLSGIQKGSYFLVCYGPRNFGSSSIEFPLLDGFAPDNAFSLTPSNDGKDILFKTEEPEQVLLNKKSIGEATPISYGDQISFGDTLIMVHDSRNL